MKRIASILLLSCFCVTNILSAKVAERVYVSTDKDVYAAGELIWCSAFCLDAVSGRISDANSVAYVELFSSQGTLLTAKIALVEGRGSGALAIPLNASTGNYRMVAYTVSGKGRKDLLADAKTVSIFNTFNTERVKGGVEIVSKDEYESMRAGSPKAGGEVSVLANRTAQTSSTVSVYLENNSSSNVTLSLSVFAEDGILPSAPSSIVDFAGKSFAGFEGPDDEHDGEVFRGRVRGKDALTLASDPKMVAVVAFPGFAEDVYAGKISADGKVRFQTVNVYGKRDMVNEILGQGADLDCYLEIDDPFVGLESKDIPELKLSQAFHTALSRRNRFVRSERTPEVDTLYEFMPKRESLLLADANCSVYHLDDYTRFTTLAETIFEIIPGIRLRKDKAGEPQMQLALHGTPSDKPQYTGNVLTLIDGVPVKSIRALMEFDPILVKDILVYPYSYMMGNLSFNGVVDFVTKKGDISSFRFDPSVRIVDWQGVCYPVAYTHPVKEYGSEDLRNTLYWHPQITLKPGERLKVDVRTPSYQGLFKVVAEGIASDGTPVYGSAGFEVR